MSDKKTNPYVERAADILSDLVKKTRSKLPAPEEEARNFISNSKSLDKLENIFKKNSKEIIAWIKKNKKL